MAERINWKKVDRDDPRFLEADPDNPNRNISASRFDPTDPTSGEGSPGAAYNEFLRTANVGDVFDWSTVGQPGLKSEFTGFNKMGTPIIKTIQSPERMNWREQIDPKAGVAKNLEKLMSLGFERQNALFLLSQSGRGIEPQDVAAFIMKSGGEGDKTVVSTTTDASGNLVTKYSDGSSTTTDPSGNLISSTGGSTGFGPGSAGYTQRKSAYDLLYNEFKKYGLESLVEGIKGLVQENVSPSEFAIRLQDTDAYKKRFAANQDRIKAGLRALTPAEYLSLEDQYQNVMRNYGLPASYWSKDSMGTQSGFNKLISGDVDAAELEDRIITAQKRVLNADVNVKEALRQFYPDITDADILAYTLDPTNALENIKRKVTAAEIGGAAMAQGLATSAGRAEELAKYGIDKAQAQTGFQTIGEFLPTAQKLGDIYATQGMGPYDQLTAEQEVFGTAGAAGAAQKRKKLTQLEQAAFGAQSGLAQGALARDRAGAY